MHTRVVMLKDVLMAIPNSDLLGVTVAVVHGQGDHGFFNIKK